ncbi:GNAT family N-acetyltransferase [Granulicella paludicola]|uniref:GNAT family N-acetyltransferase n=1 Tax=Granulicella paludicola TaxID=474951 RepID=UPI0021DF47AA|nr:GNAT family N-acetyltransferase [Granulicella paludicola]
MIRVGEAEDVAGILRVERGCEEAPQWGERVWSGLLTEGGELRCVMVAKSELGVVGFVVIGGVAGVAEIESVAVEVEARGQGIGKSLCLAAMRWAEERGAVAMELEVRASNVMARRMYAGLGFVEQGMRKGYYAGPVEDAVLMAAVLTPR